MLKWLEIIARTLLSTLRSHQALAIENLALQQQLAVLKHRHPRLHGELLKLGIDVSEAAVSKYLIRRRGPPSQTHPFELRRLLPQCKNAFVPGKGFARRKGGSAY
jgi:hypothetical protein